MWHNFLQKRSSAGAAGVVSTMKMLKRVLLAAAMSWSFSVTLGLLFAACASGRFSLSVLRLPGVIPVALIISTGVSIVMTPIAIWSVRTGLKNLCVYAPILLIVLAGYDVVVIPKTGAYGLYGLLLLALVGSAILGFIPPAGQTERP
jgi:hypothetical protein